MRDGSATLTSREAGRGCRRDPAKTSHERWIRDPPQRRAVAGCVLSRAVTRMTVGWVTSSRLAWYFASGGMVLRYYVVGIKGLVAEVGSCRAGPASPRRAGRRQRRSRRRSRSGRPSGMSPRRPRSRPARRRGRRPRTRSKRRPTGSLGGVRGLGPGVGQQDRELVAAVAGRDVGRAQRRPDHLGGPGRTRSPKRWPNVSLTSLKSSRSSIRTLSGERDRWARTTSSPNRSWR